MRAVPGAVIDLLPATGTAVKVIRFAGPYVVPLVVDHMLSRSDRGQATVTESDAIDYMLHVDMFSPAVGVQGEPDDRSAVMESGQRGISVTTESESKDFM
jgi:hypothetical protein